MTAATTVFISYRRTNAHTARAIAHDLAAHGYDVFMDHDALDSGQHADLIRRQIAGRAHFVMILTPSAVRRCVNINDWVRQEVRVAIDSGRNVIPVLLAGSGFPDVERFLTGQLAVLGSYDPGFFDPADPAGSLAHLRSHQLTLPPLMPTQSAPESDPAYVAAQQAITADLPPATPDQRRAEQIAERANAAAFNHRAYRRALPDYDTALTLNPADPMVYLYRGMAHAAMKQHNAALEDFSEASRRDPEMAAPHYQRSLILAAQGEAAAADAALAQAIALDPGAADAYSERGARKARRGDLAGATADFMRALELHPAHPQARLGLGLARARRWIAALQGTRDRDAASRP
jgi:Tfp pilus assembly protein PilF